MFELWNQKSPPEHATEKRILAATILSIILDMHSLYHCLCPAMTHIWFFPPMEMHMNKQPSHWNLDQILIVARKISFSCPTAVFFILEWKSERLQESTVVLYTENYRESYKINCCNNDEYPLIVALWSGAMDRNPKKIVSMVKGPWSTVKLVVQKARKGTEA